MRTADWRASVRRQRAASALSYGLVVGLVAVLSIGAVQSVGDSVTALFGGVAEDLGRTGQSIPDAGDEDSPQPNQAPAAPTLSATQIQENSGAGASIGTLSASDPDAGQTVSFSLGSAGGDEAAFQIVGTDLQAAQDFDFESPEDTGGTAGDNIYVVEVIATDDGSPAASTSAMLAVTVTGANEPPQWVTEANLGSAPEGQALMIVLEADDPDNDGLSYAVTGGMIPPGMSLAAGGTLSGTPDDDQIDGNQSFTFTVEADDGQGGTAERSFSLEITPTPPTAGLVAEWTADEGGGTTLIDSAGANDGTLMGDVTRTPGVIGLALDFDGIGTVGSGDADYVTMGDNSALEANGAFAISFWMNADRTDVQQSILGKRPLCSVGNFFDFRFGATTTNDLSLELRNGNAVALPDTDLVLPNQWIHLVVMRDTDSSEFIAVRDGDTGAAARASTAGIDLDLSNDAEFALGVSPCDTTGFEDPVGSGETVANSHPPYDGQLDQIRFYNRALSDAEIADLYNGGNGL